MSKNYDTELEELLKRAEELKATKMKLRLKADINKKRYDILSKIPLECPFCKKITSVYLLTKHNKGKKCKELRDAVINTHLDGRLIENKFLIQLNDIKRCINKPNMENITEQ